MSIGDRIKRLRGKIPRKNFSMRLGVDQTTIVNYETGKRQPTLEFVAKLCDLYSVRSDWLIWGRPPMTVSPLELEEQYPGAVPEDTVQALGERQPSTEEKIKKDKQITEEWAMALNTADFEGLWGEYRRETEARRGWLQIEVIKRFPEFIEWLEQRQDPLKPAQIAALKKREQLLHYGLPNQLEDD